MFGLTRNNVIVLSVFLALASIFCKPLLSGFYAIKLIYMKREYPKVMTTTETLKEISSGKSIARFGDGELKLIMGRGLVRNGDNSEYQVYDRELSNRLRKIIRSPTGNCIIAINNFCDKWDDKELPDETKFSYWETFWLNYWEKLKGIYKEGYTYGCAEISRITVFKENSLEDVKKIWDKRKVLFVVGSGSYFVYEKRLFDNIKSAKMLVVLGKSSFNKYDSILNTIKTFDKGYLILLSLGPCATV